LHNYNNKWKTLNDSRISLSLHLSRVPPTLVEAEPPPPLILGVVRLCRGHRLQEPPILFEH
jgi:hypothetical protein